MGLGGYFWYTVYSVFMLLRSEETAKMVRSAIRPDSTNSGTGNHLTSSSTVETEETTDLCIVQPTSACPSGSKQQQQPQQPLRPSSIPISQSTPSFAHVKETIQRAVGGTPPPPYEVIKSKSEQKTK